MSKVQITLTEANCDDWFAFEETLNNELDEMVPLEEFEFEESDVFFEVISPFSYRPGHIDQYVERDGKVWFIDDLNEDEAWRLPVTKEQLLKKAEQFK